MACADGTGQGGADWSDRIAMLDRTAAARLAERARLAPLYAHAYAFHLNMRLGGMVPRDLLNWAAAHRLSGVKIHIEDGEGASLLHMPDRERARFGAAARALDLDLHVETSSTEPDDLARTAAIAHATGASSMRCYPRYEGPLSEVIARTVTALRGLDALDPAGRLAFTLEQHEDLTSDELVGIVRAVGLPRLGLLFDFGNMVNAGEEPLAALARQAPYVTEVHVKDCLILPDRGGWAHQACVTGEGDLPLGAMFVELLLLGRDRPQVRTFALEEEEGYFAPAMRFPGEGPDPVIPARNASVTDPGPGDLQDRLAREAAMAERQVRTVRAILGRIADKAEERAASA